MLAQDSAATAWGKDGNPAFAGSPALTDPKDDDFAFGPGLPPLGPPPQPGGEFPVWLNF